MISFRCHVCAVADRIVSAIHFSALYAGIRMETNGFMNVGTFNASGVKTLRESGWQENSSQETPWQDQARVCNRWVLPVATSLDKLAYVC